MLGARTQVLSLVRGGTAVATAGLAQGLLNRPMPSLDAFPSKVPRSGAWCCRHCQMCVVVGALCYVGPTHLAPRVRLAAAWLKAHPDSSLEPAAEGVRVKLAKEAIGGSVALRRLRSVSQGAAAVLPPPELGIGRGLAKLSSACNSCDPCSSAAEQPGRLAVQAQHSQAFGRPPPSAAVLAAAIRGLSTVIRLPQWLPGRPQSPLPASSTRRASLSWRRAGEMSGDGDRRRERSWRGPAELACGRPPPPPPPALTSAAHLLALLLNRLARTSCRCAITAQPSTTTMWAQSRCASRGTHEAPAACSLRPSTPPWATQHIR